MGNYAQLKESISNIIKTNGNEEITGLLLQNVLLSIISNVGLGATFKDIAVPETAPGLPDQNVFYLASTNGVYSNFGGIKVENEICIFEYSGDTWKKKTVFSNFVAKDLSNISSSALRDKAGVFEVYTSEYDIDENHSVTLLDTNVGEAISNVAENQEIALYFVTTGAMYGSGISPVSTKIQYPNQGQAISTVATFVGTDDYIHRLILDESGNITRQYAYSLDDFATKEDIEEILAGDFTSQGYLPTRIIDLGTYNDGVFSLTGTSYWGDMQTTLYSYLDGGCSVLLRARTQFDEPQVFAPTRIYRSGDTVFYIEFIISPTQICEIRINEDADIESGESLFSQTLISIGGGGSGSGTVTTTKYSETDYKEI